MWVLESKHWGTFWVGWYPFHCWICPSLFPFQPWKGSSFIQEPLISTQPQMKSSDRSIDNDFFSSSNQLLSYDTARRTQQVRPLRSYLVGWNEQSTSCETLPRLPWSPWSLQFGSAGAETEHFIPDHVKTSKKCVCKSLGGVRTHSSSPEHLKAGTYPGFG